VTSAASIIAMRQSAQVRKAYAGSDGQLTLQVCDLLLRRGPSGELAVLLFRALKASKRAKVYRKRMHRNLSYERKGDAIRLLCEFLDGCDPDCWGWGIDRQAEGPFRHVVDVRRAPKEGRCRRSPGRSSMPVREPVSGGARLFLEIRAETQAKTVRTTYVLTYLESCDEIGHPAWRLTKGDGTHYDVVLTEHGPVCSCPDFVFNREYQEKKCKHCEALKASGLLRIVAPNQESSIPF